MKNGTPKQLAVNRKRKNRTGNYFERIHIARALLLCMTRLYGVGIINLPGASTVELDHLEADAIFYLRIKLIMEIRGSRGTVQDTIQVPVSKCILYFNIYLAITVTII